MSGVAANKSRGKFGIFFSGTVTTNTGNYYPRQRDGRIDGIDARLTESRWVAQQLNRLRQRRGRFLPSITDLSLLVPHGSHYPEKAGIPEHLEKVQ